MKKSVRSVLTKVGFAALVLSLNFFAACEIGLGSSVDVEAPKIDFADSTVDSGAVVRDAFAVFGSWEDDGSIGSINATLKNLETGAEVKKAGTIGDKQWSVAFSPADDSITDGTYELSIVIKDGADHESKISRSFIIDNTPPLVVLSRPSTKIGAASFDSYGQKFTLEGKAADDNDVSLIEVNVYADADCSGSPLKTISLPSVPLTIETDVAEYSKTEANDYSVIYGIVDDNGIAKRNGGTVDRFCKLVVYDGAQRYPADGSAQTEADKKGNSIDYYYLNSDLAELFTEGYKITELYHILNGTYSGNTSRTTAPDGVVSLLHSDSTKITTGQFRLNPENSPHFVVSARSILESGHTVDESPLTNGNSKLEVEITPGLDGHLIKEDTIGIYLVRCDNYGNPLKADGSAAASESEAKIIWLVETDKHQQQAEVTQSGSTYKFKTKTEVGNAYYPDLNIGENYYVAVVGKDMQGNNILCEGIYGFQLITSGLNIDVGLTVTPDWLSTNSAAAANAKSVSVKLTYSTENKPFDIYRGVGSSTISETPIAENITTSPYIDNSIDISTEPTVVVYKIKGNNSAESNVKTIELKYDDGIPQKPTITTCPDKNIADPDNLTFQGKAEDNTDGSGIEHVYVQLWNGLKTDEATATVKTAELEATYSAAGKDWLFVMQKESEDNAIKQAFANVFAAEGQKTIKITSVDKVGLKNTEWKEFIYDKAAPVIKITSSKQGVESAVSTVPDIVGKTLVLSGSITEGFGIESIKIEQTKEGGIGSIEKSLTISSSWTTEALPLKSSTDAYSEAEIDNHVADGTYTYKIKVTDKAGKISSVEKTISLNTTAPTITVKSPSFSNGESEWQLSKNVMISGTASSPATIAGIYYKVLTAADSAPMAPANPTVETNWSGTGTNGGWKIASGTTNWAFTANAQDSATNKVYIAAVDNVGNVTDVKNLTLKVDASSPDFGALYYNISGTDTYKPVEGQIYVDNTKTLTVYGTFKDAESGVKELNFTSDVTPSVTYSTGTISDVTVANVKALFETNANPAPTTTIQSANTYWKAVFTGFTKNNVGQVKASGLNYAGGDTGDQKLFNISYDDKAPVVSNVSFKTTAAAPNKVYPETTGAADYWVNNTISGAKFVVAGVATDNFGVDDVELKLNGVVQTRKEGSSVSEWEYELDLSSYTEIQTAEVKIQAIDVAGHKSDADTTTEDADETIFTIHFDQTKPLPKHWADAKNKDVYFRIGSADNDYKKDSTKPTGYDTSKVESGETWDNTLDKDVGSKYSFGSYGNDSTIEIRGTFKEEGSGLRTIYYKIFNASVPTTSELTKLESGDLSTGGYKEFAPLSTPEKRRVPYNDENGAKSSVEIESNYRVSLPGFDDQNNYLVLIAEDYVGNRQFDMLKISDKLGSDGKLTELTATEIEADPTLSTNKWNSKFHNTATSYLNLNKDTDAPAIATVTSGWFTNGTNTITLTGTASDSLAGLKSVTVSIDEIVGTGNNAVHAEWSQVLDAEDLTGTDSDKWTVTIPVTAFADKTDTTKKLPSGTSITAYATAADKAGVGNKKTISAATITIDTTEPTVTINNPKDADTTDDIIDVNGTIELSGTSSDAYGIEKVLGICYQTTITTEAPIKPSKGTLAANATWTAPSGWKKLADTTTLTKDDATTNWTYQKINTADLSGSEAIADETNVWFTVAVLDKAGNVGYATPKMVKVDQNTDRPIIKFTNLNIEDGKYILKFVEDSVLEGNISDDDADTKVVDIFVAGSQAITSAPEEGTGDSDWKKTISDNKITWSKTGFGSTEYNKVTGDYTFTPAVKTDGKKEVYFYVKDNKGKEFYTAYKAGETAVDSDKLHQPYQQFKQETKTDNSAMFEYKSDKTAPSISDVKILVTAKWGDVKGEQNATDKYYTDEACTSESKVTNSTDDTTDVYSMVDPGTGTVVGGTKKSKIKFIVTAKDDNGIKDMSLEYKPTGVTTAIQVKTSDSGSVFTANNNNTPVTWKTKEIDVSGFATGSVSVTVTATDQSGLFANQNPIFMVDKTGPTINITSPKSTDEITGKLTISGTSTDEGGAGSATIDFIVPTKTQSDAAGTTASDKETYYKSLADSEWGGHLYKDATVSAFRYDFNGDTTNDNALFDIYTKDDTSDPKIYDLPFNDNGIYSVPVIFRSKDTLGNISIKEYSITYNPDGDKPKTEITYPSKANYESVTKQYVTLGGEIRVTGSVSIPSLTTTPERVYLQIADSKKAFDSTDKTKAGTGTGNYGYTIKTLTNVGSDIGKTIQGITGTAAANWWGIQAERSSNAWSISLNSDDQLNPTGSEPNEIYIRACGVNTEGKMGAWSEPVCIHVDASAPQYTTKLYQFNGTPSVGSQTAEKDYVPGIYLKGQWYLGLHITDDEKVTVASVKEGGTSGTPLPDSDITKIGDGTTAADLFIKLDNNATFTKTYTVTAHDEAEGNKHYIYPTYDINIDNTPPDLTDIITGEGYPIHMTKQRTSNNVITFGATATDTGSGFSRLAYYFKRGTSIELPLPIAENANQKKWKAGASGTAYTSTSLTKPDGEALYGVELTGTGAISGENTTFTSSETLSSAKNKFIRKGGIVKLAGTYHKIEDVTDNTVTVSGKIDSMVSANASDTKTAFFPAALIVDNTSAESSTWSGGVNTISGDDGDGVTESVKKSGATWTWDSSIYAGELDDGEVTLVCVAFDVAENAAKSETKFMLTNKTPRVSKLYLATDLNGDTKYSDNELGTSVITASGSKTVQKYYSALSSGSLQEVFTVYGNTDDENNSTTTSGITMRDKLGMAFEFISGYEGYGAGQGGLKYKLTVAQTPLSDTDAGVAQVKGENETLPALEEITAQNTKFTTTDSLNGNYFLELDTDDFKATTPKYSGYKELLVSGETDYDENANYLNYLRITLWDNSNGAAGTKDGAKTEETYTNSNGDPAKYYTYASFGAQWTTFNIPLYMDLVDGQKPTVEIDDPVALGTTDAPTGHVDLKATLSSLTGSNEFDSDDKVSGKIKFTGTINDDKRIDYINLTVSKNFSSKAVSGVRLVTYNPGTGGFKVGTAGAPVTIGGNSPTEIVPNSATGLKFKLLTNEFSTKNGHTVTWELEVDSELVAGIAATDVVFTVTANDMTSTTNTTHRVDIVPYIASFKRSTTLTDTHRSRLGKYQVVLGESVNITGWNLPGETENAIKLQVSGQEKLAAGTVKTSITATSGSSNAMSFDAPETSGYIKVVTNGVSSTNNFNSGNEMEGDYDSDTWNDNIYLNVWKNDEYFYFSNDPISPAMDRIPNGNGQYRLYGGWATNGSKFFASYPNTSGSGNTGNATNPANSGGTGFYDGQSFGDPATFYDVIIDDSGNRYNMLLDCWQGNTDGWGQNFVVNRNGYYSHVNAGSGNAVASVTAQNANYRHVIERMGNKVSPDNANSSDGYDEIFNQFLNPRLALYDGVAYLSYYDRYAKCLKYAALKPIDSATNIEFKYSTEGMRNGGNNSAGTFRKDGYTSGDCVVAGYDTLQSGGSKTNLDVGRWSAVAVDTIEKAPVIAYYDSTNKRLMLATASGNGNGTMTNHTTAAQKTSYPLNSNSPVLTGDSASTTEGDAWSRQEVKGSAADSLLRLGQYVSMVTDAGGNLHIACNGAKGGNKLYYIYGAKGTYGNYTFTVTCVDAEGAGTWTDIQLEDSTKSGAAAKPVISYYDPSNDSSENAVKVAYLDNGEWDTMTAPLASSAVSDRITLALDVTDGANYTADGTTNNSKLSVGYVSGRFDCIYLRKE